MPIFRLYASLYFSPPLSEFKRLALGQIDQRRRFDAVVDTGARLTTLPYSIWKPFQNEIEFAHDLSREPRQITVGAKTTAYVLGRIRLAALDDDNRWLPLVWTVARCLDSRPDPHEALLGLTSPFLMNKRKLINKRDALSRSGPEWWIEDSFWPF